ncbi:DUF1178 family protein [uncultured Sphaerotilus sp.]|uniref:DUF1178 family protein n=1 Tax=uncultured Sphaerotilus sp. TaxID=474984 RepID=UPI0030CA2506
MKVLNLQCASGHAFEGWFGSEDDYQSQQSRGLLTCPMCGLAEVLRMPSAPRLNLSGARTPLASVPSAPASPTPVAGSRSRPEAAARHSQAPQTPESAQAEAILLQAMRHVLANTEDVGAHFAEEARRIHHGEIEHRNIRGETTPIEAQALRDEGIDVFHLPIPDGLKGPLQ